MPTAISAANFQTALGNCHDSISSGDFAAAWKYYAMAEAQHSGLLLRMGTAGQTNDRRNALDGLKAAIAAAEKSGNVVTDTERRMISTRTGFGS